MTTDSLTHVSTRAPRPGARIPEFFKLKVCDVREETLESVSIALEVPPDLMDRYVFTPGEYLTFRHQGATAEVRRCYSIASGLDDGELRVVVKKVEQGIFSSFAHSALRPGMDLDVMTPMGGFTAHVDSTRTQTYLGIAAGSGITPIISIIKSVLRREPRSTFILLYANRSTRSIIFREALDDLKDQYLDRLSVLHVLSREATDTPLSSGRLDGARVKELACSAFDPRAIGDAYLCGPADMMAELRKTLASLGVAPDRIHGELFTSAGDANARPAARSADVSVVEGSEVTTMLNGVARQFRMGSSDLSIVDAAHASGIELPYSCKGGMCSTCRAKLVEGEVEMAFNYSLEKWELDAGFVLTCQARPVTARVVVDYDHV